MTAPELSPEEKAEVARFGIHEQGDGLPEVRIVREVRAQAVEAAIEWLKRKPAALLAGSDPKAPGGDEVLRRVAARIRKGNA